MKFNKKSNINELLTVTLMSNEGCSNSGCKGNNHDCSNTNNTAGCGCH